MTVDKILILLKKYGKCPECNNQYVGNGQGSLVIEDKTFSKTCRCGWSVKVDENDNPI